MLSIKTQLHCVVCVYQLFQVESVLWSHEYEETEKILNYFFFLYVRILGFSYISFKQFSLCQLKELRQNGKGSRRHVKRVCGLLICEEFVISRVSFYREVRFIVRFVISRDSFYYKGALVISQGILYQVVNVMLFDLQDIQTANSDQNICNDRQKI